MSLIKDVKYELERLNLSNKQLRKFGITFGILFFITFIYFFLKSDLSSASVLLIVAGITFIVLGLIFPLKLKLLYKYWMGIAFFLGWFVSRIILTILFAFIITPIGILLKIINKTFLNLDFPIKEKTNWVIKNNSESKIEKMY